MSGVGYGGVGGSSGFGSNDEGKLYLETALLERHLNESMQIFNCNHCSMHFNINNEFIIIAELKRLVEMPTGLEENEWMASNSKT